MHKDAGKSTKMIFHPRVTENPQHIPFEEQLSPRTGTEGYGEIKLFTGLQAAFEL